MNFNIFLILYNVFNRIILGFLLKFKRFIIFLKFFHIYFFAFILKYSFFFVMHSLLDLIVTDYPLNVYSRFEIIYSFSNCWIYIRFFIKSFINTIKAVISISKLFSSSSWLEREAWDLFGIRFILNTDLRRILNDYGFKGFPLRKDFPLVGFIECFYDDSNQYISSEPVELIQKLRQYRFEDSWGIAL